MPPNPILGVSYHSVGRVCGGQLLRAAEVRKTLVLGDLLDGPGSVVLAALADRRGRLHHPQPRSRSDRGAEAADAVFLPDGLGLSASAASAFNLSIRYIGFSLTYAIAIGLSACWARWSRRWCAGQLADILAKPGAVG